MSIKFEELFKLGRQLERYNEVFYQFWRLGRPILDDRIPTAAVSFSLDGDYIDFRFNPQFWEETTDIEKCFIIAHECLHVLLNHGKRTTSFNKQIANIAGDIVINEMLFKVGGFEKKDISFVEDIVFLKTFLPDEPEDESLEYYYYKLIENAIEIPASLFVTDIPQQNQGSKELQEKLQKIGKEGNLTPTELEDKEAGTEIGSNVKTVTAQYIPKKKWETVIKNWVKKRLSFLEDEQWVRPNRRIASYRTELFLPSEQDNEIDKKEKIQLYFFQDTSSSCLDFADRFFRVANTIPKDKFNIRLFCFDTKVYETSFKDGKLYGFGGTCFNAIERHIQKVIRDEQTRYPQAVFVITDGYGTNVQPERPENWYWFLSNDYKYHIPEKSHTFMLKDFE
jgi:hypothetical protein